jgi:hypothetical protein
MRGLFPVNSACALSHMFYSRLEGGAAADDGISSSSSRPRLLRAGALPLLAAAILGRKGELLLVRSISLNYAVHIPHRIVYQGIEAI